MTSTQFIREANSLFSDSYLFSVDHEYPEKIASQKLSRKFKAFLKSQFKDYNIYSFSGYCESSGFIEKDGKFIYISISDLRYWKNWSEDVLIRVADSERDFRGHRNHRTTINNLKQDVEKLINDYDKEIQYKI